MINTRLIDVFFNGPLQMLCSFYIHNKFLKYYLFSIGFVSIIYNGHNYLLLETNILKSPLLPTSILTKNGKTQFHRLYNVVIMYPLMALALYQERNTLPPFLKIFLFLDILIGSVWNANNYIKYSYQQNTNT